MTDLETRLAEMDRRLREIQEELAPGRTAPPPPPRPREPPPAPPAPPAPPVPTPLPDLYRSLLASMRVLLDGYEAVLGQPGQPSLTLSAGPFPSTAALREFERALQSLPGVQAVNLRGYEGSDRALVEVLLDGNTT